MIKPTRQLFLKLVAIIFVAAWATSCEKCATLFSLSTVNNTTESFYSQDFYDCQEALRRSDIKEARKILEQVKADQKDSADYYRYMVLASKYYYTTMNTDSFMYCHKQIRNYLDSRTGQSTDYDERLRLESELQRGVYEIKMVGRIDSALTYFKQALEQVDRFPQLGAYRLVILTNIADAYKQMGQYDQCINYFQQAIKLADSTSAHISSLITINIGIASAYAAMGGFHESAKWWAEAAKLKPKMERGELFQYLNNRGNDYYLQGNYEESLKCFLELDSMIADDPSMHWERMYEWANLSDVYIKLGKPELAVPLIEQTQVFFAEQQQFIPLFYIFTQRIELAVQSGQMDEALRLINENPMPDMMIPEQKQLRRKVLMQYYEKTGQWQRYAQTLHDYTALHDSMANDNMRMRVSQMLLQYTHEKEISQKQHELEEKENSFRWAVALLIASAIISVLLIIIFVLKHRQQKLREAEIRGSIASLRMEGVRNRITPHFIYNALASEMLAQMEGKKVDLEPLVQLLHRGIELTDIDQSSLSEELEFIQFYCKIESRSVGDDFEYEVRLSDDIDAERVMLPSMSVQILVENAIKHGLKARKPQADKPRKVTVTARKQGDATLIEVIDNGVGLPNGRKRRERTGLRVMQQTIYLLNEKHQQSASYHHGDTLMDYGMDNYTHADAQTGCRAWLLLPDHFDYTLR